jgi:hypothetical protein
MPNEIWERICQHAGHEFTMRRGGTFTYDLIGPNTIQINRPTFTHNVGRGVFEEAYAMGLPLSGPGAITHLRAPAFVWAILHDPRIMPEL